MSDLFPFTASNGLKVDAIGAEGRRHPRRLGDAVLRVDEFDAAREYFLAERDAELGRWRSKEHPEYVVYPEAEDADTIRVLFEPGGGVGNYHRSWLDGVVDVDGWAIASVVREYFAAHPEPKPWHEAKNGEIWRVTLAGREYARSVHRRIHQPNTFVDPVGREPSFPVDDPRITSGRRIWPEGGDES